MLKTRAVQGVCNSVGVAGFYPHGGAQAGIHTEMESMGKGYIRELEIVSAGFFSLEKKGEPKILVNI